MINENYLLYLYGIATMVTSEANSDTGLPDPSNSSSSDFTLTNDGIILFSDNDDEEFDPIQFDQYQPLPIEESTESSQESSDDDCKYFW